MDKKYTYFISSTFSDLIEERKTVANYILKIDEIPIGMEQFGAIDTSQWSYITKLIDTSDFFILIVAGKYGSVDDSDPDDLSYTHKEFRYAREQKIPIIAVVHKRINSLPVEFSETDPSRLKKLSAFRQEVGTARLIAHYENQSDLLVEIASSISKGKRTFNRPGWIRNTNNDRDNSSKSYVEHNKLLLLELASMAAKLKEMEKNWDKLKKNNDDLIIEHNVLLESYNSSLEQNSKIPGKDLLIEKLKGETLTLQNQLDDYRGNTLGGIPLIDFGKNIDLSGNFRMPIISMSLGSLSCVMSKMTAFIVVVEEAVLSQSRSQMNYLSPEISHKILKRLYLLANENDEDYDLMTQAGDSTGRALVEIFAKEGYLKLEKSMLCFTSKGQQTYDRYKGVWDSSPKRVYMHKQNL